MKKLCIFLGLISCSQLFGQHSGFLNQKKIEISKNDSISWSNIPRLKYDKTKDAKLLLPEHVDNSTKIYFPDITYQPIGNCGQCSGVKYSYSYELNRILNKSSRNPMTVFSEFFNVYATAQGNPEHTLKTWENMKSIGCVMDLDLGYDQVFCNGHELINYLSGYNWFYKAMQNQVDDYAAISLDTEEGILTMKHWLHNHLSGDSVGGVGIIYIGIPNTNDEITSGYDSGKIIIPKFTTYPNHSMTIVGYDDRIEYDYNGDGMITNDLDINGDGVVNVRDWEKGAVIIANSYGSDWANNGFVYVPYRILAFQTPQNGIWNSSMYVVKPKLPTKPKTTFRFSVAHRNKQLIQLFAGVSSNCNSTTPDHTLEIPFFKFIEPCPDTLVVGAPIEFGFDVTPLLNYIQPGQKARFFFQILEVDPLNRYNGYIQNFSVIDYTHGNNETKSNVNPVNIVNNGLTTLYVDVCPEFSKPMLTSNRLPNAAIGTAYKTQLTAQKGTSPYRYRQSDGYLVSTGSHFVSNNNGLTQIVFPAGSNGSVAIHPQFPIRVYNSIHTDSLYINPHGYIQLHGYEYYWPFNNLDETQLKGHAAIAPLMSYLAYDKPGFGVWYKSTPDSLYVHWRCRFDCDPSSLLDFSTTINRNGNITFEYDTMNFSCYNPWVRGISKGNGVDLTKIGSDFVINSQLSIRCEFISIDTSITINSEGLVTANPTAAFTNKKINVTILDNNDLETQSYTYLSTGTPPNLSILSYTLNADNQSWYSPLDTVSVSFILKNTSGNALSNIPLQLMSPSSNVDVLKFNEIITEILPNSELTVNGAFSMKASSIINTEIIENLIIQNSTTGEQVGVIKINLTPISPIKVGEAILDSLSLNTLISNSTQTLLFPIHNPNRMPITGINATLQTTSNLVELLNSTVHIDTIPPYSVDTLRFKMLTSEVTSLDAFIPFSGQLADSQGTTVYFLKTYQRDPSLIEDYENANHLFVFPSEFSDTIPYKIANIGCNSNHSLMTLRATSATYFRSRTFSLDVHSWSKIEFDYLTKESLLLATKRFGYNIDGNAVFLNNSSEWKHIVLNLDKGIHQFTLKYSMLTISDSVFVDNLSLPFIESKVVGYSLTPNEIKLKCKPDTLLNFEIETNNLGSSFSEIYFDVIPAANSFCNWLGRNGALTLTTNQSASIPYSVNSHQLLPGNYTSYICFYDQSFYQPIKVSLDVIDGYQPPAAGSVVVYPNPATDKVSFDFISAEAKTASLNIYDILGRKVYQQEQFVDFGSNIKTLTFDISNVAGGQISKGLYLYQLSVDNDVYQGKITIVP